MVPLNELVLFAGAALVMVLTPGPQHDLSHLALHLPGQARGRDFAVRSDHRFPGAHVCRGARLTALFMTIPLAYEALKWIGAGYLLYLAWQAVKPGARSPFEARNLPIDPPRKLFADGIPHQPAESQDRAVLSFDLPAVRVA